jgi:hypothetical protein
VRFRLCLLAGETSARVTDFRKEEQVDRFTRIKFVSTDCDIGDSHELEKKTNRVQNARARPSSTSRGLRAMSSRIGREALLERQ